MAEQKVFRLIEKNGKAVLADLDNNHLQPKDALKVAQSITAFAESKSYVYIGLRSSDGVYKIGFTANLPQRENALGIEFVHTIECDAYGDFDARVTEARLHKFFEKQRIEGEWFKIDLIDVGLIQTYCATSQKTLVFLDEFDSAFNKMAEFTKQESILAMAADLVDGIIFNSTERAVAWYAIRKMPVWAREDGDEDKAKQFDVLSRFISEISSRRKVRDERLKANHK